MDQRERLSDFEEMIRLALNGRVARLWTCLPATIISYNPAELTCVLQPTIQARMTNQDGSLTDVTLPNLLDCPVVFPGCAGFLLTFPLAAGDEGLVIFSSRCIDNWWARGGVQPQFELRMHDLSDGFFIPGCYSKPNVPPNISTTHPQLRTRDGLAYVEIEEGHIVHLQGPGGIVLSGNTVVSGSIEVSGTAAFGGTVEATGAITLDAALHVVGPVQLDSSLDVNLYIHGKSDVSAGVGTVDQIGLQGHKHSSVTGGVGQSGPPVPGT